MWDTGRWLPRTTGRAHGCTCRWVIWNTDRGLLRTSGRVHGCTCGRIIRNSRWLLRTSGRAHGCACGWVIWNTSRWLLRTHGRAHGCACEWVIWSTDRWLLRSGGRWHTAIIVSAIIISAIVALIIAVTIVSVMMVVRPHDACRGSSNIINIPVDISSVATCRAVVTFTERRARLTRFERLNISRVQVRNLTSKNRLDSAHRQSASGDNGIKSDIGSSSQRQCK